MSEPVVPPVPRPAASLLVLRRTQAGPEVLMGLRGAGHKFMPNRLVFPGGAVDPVDHAAPFASPLRAGVRRRLEVSAAPSLAGALAAAAAREFSEETGLTLGNPPHLEGLDYLCRAVTPPISPMRFDARFFVVDAAAVSGTLAGSGELEDLRYFPLAEALALDLAQVTRGVLGQFSEWLALTQEQRDARARTPVMFERVWGEE
jgi:8-oxo-dGTP pyrophosphatase MutT (NUDIX family)